jgi:methionyl-tRNA formyltransferase
MLISKSNDWVVLFGGKGRECNLEAMTLHGISIRKLFIPSSFYIKNKEIISKIESWGLTPEVIDRATLEEQLVGQGNLLSIGFPYIIPERVLNRYEIALNLHPTLLPRYKGPTTGAYIIMNGEDHSGSTVHLMTKNVDEGPILGQSLVQLDGFDTIRSMRDKVYAAEPEILISTLKSLRRGIQASPMEEINHLDYYRKRTPLDSEIDANLKLYELVSFIRACDNEDYPAFFMYENEKVYVKLWRTNKKRNQHPESL